MKPLYCLWLGAAASMTVCLAYEPIPQNPRVERIAVRHTNSVKVSSKLVDTPAVLTPAERSTARKGHVRRAGDIDQCPALVAKTPVARQALAALLKPVEAELPRATGLSRLGGWLGAAVADLIPPFDEQPIAVEIEQPRSPAMELADAAQDAARLPPDAAIHARYLSLYNVPRAQRGNAARVVSYTLNALSRSRSIYLPVRVSSSLLRIDTRWFAEDEAVHEWEHAWFGLTQKDPYWHVPTLIYFEGKTQHATVDGGWLNQSHVAALRNYTGSVGAILRADYFVANATIPPAYYEFIGLPATEGEFLKGLGVDEKAIERLRADAGANLDNSGITDKTRRVVWKQGLLGGIYNTLDVEKVDAEHDPARRIVSVGKFALQHEAEEWFAMAPNGFWWTALFDKNGKRQDAVPVKVATDSIATDQHAPDKEVVPMQSCYRCHVESGLRTLSDDQSKTFAGGSINLKSYDYATIQRARDFYNEPRLLRQMAFDRQTHDAAVYSATGGWTCARAVQGFSDAVRMYAYDLVTPEMARRELGGPISPACTDVRNLQLLKGTPVLRGLFEQSFAEASTLGAK
jgi:hypothetical protein